MKRIALWALALLVSGCASLRTIRDEAEAIGTFRLKEIGGGTYDIEIRPDHSCALSSYTAVSRAPLVEGTWTFNGGVVTIAPANARPIAFELAHRGSEVVLVSERGRGLYVRLSEKEPNKCDCD